MIDAIETIKDEMELLALKWARISKTAFEKKFSDLEVLDSKELKQRYESIKHLRGTGFAELKKVWDRLPESQWEVTFATQMRDLPEYTDLRRALTAFRNQFYGTKKNVKKATSVKD